MSAETITIAVGGGTPGADANDYILFDSTVAFAGAGLLAQSGIKRIIFTVKNGAAGTLKAKESTDKGTNWDQYRSDAVAIAGAGAVSGPFDYDVAGFKDFQLVWTNGGVAQNPWRAALKGVTERAAP